MQCYYIATVFVFADISGKCAEQMGRNNNGVGANANVQFGFVVENGTSANEIYDIVVKSMSADADINVDAEAEESTSDSIE